MNDEIKSKLSEWYERYGKLSAVFLQARLKISFKEASRLIEEFHNGK